MSHSLSSRCQCSFFHADEKLIGAVKVTQPDPVCRGIDLLSSSNFPGYMYVGWTVTENGEPFTKPLMFVISTPRFILGKVR